MLLFSFKLYIQKTQVTTKIYNQLNQIQLIYVWDNLDVAKVCNYLPYEPYYWNLWHLHFIEYVNDIFCHYYLFFIANRLTSYKKCFTNILFIYIYLIIISFFLKTLLIIKSLYLHCKLDLNFLITSNCFILYSDERKASNVFILSKGSEIMFYK